MKKDIKEPLCFDGVSLNPTIFLRWIQTLENSFKVTGCSNEECFMIAIKKLQGQIHYWFKKALQGKPRIKT